MVASMRFYLLYPYYRIRYRRQIAEALALGLEEQARRLQEQAIMGKSCCEILVEQLGTGETVLGLKIGMEIVEAMRQNHPWSFAEQQTKQGEEPIK